MRGLLRLGALRPRPRRLIRVICGAFRRLAWRCHACRRRACWCCICWCLITPHCAIVLRLRAASHRVRARCHGFQRGRRDSGMCSRSNTTGSLFPCGVRVRTLGGCGRLRHRGVDTRSQGLRRLSIFGFNLPPFPTSSPPNFRLGGFRGRARRLLLGRLRRRLMNIMWLRLRPLNLQPRRQIMGLLRP